MRFQVKLRRYCYRYRFIKQYYIIVLLFFIAADIAMVIQNLTYSLKNLVILIISTGRGEPFEKAEQYLQPAMVRPLADFNQEAGISVL